MIGTTVELVARGRRGMVMLASLIPLLVTTVALLPALMVNAFTADGVERVDRILKRLQEWNLGILGHGATVGTDPAPSDPGPAGP